MKRFQFYPLSLLILVCLVACSNTTSPQPPPDNSTPVLEVTKESNSAAHSTPSATEEEAATAQPAAKKPAKKALIGFTSSKTGQYNIESERQNNGLALWITEINKAGGIKLADGSKVTFESKFYDDESSKDRVQELYTRLATEDKADFLISPYSSGLTEAAAVVAEQNKKLMITTGAADDATYKKGFTLVYQTYTPASRYLTGALDIIAKADPKAKKIAFAYENDKFSMSVAEAAKKYAETEGYEIVLYEGYDKGTVDFAPLINKIQQAKAEIILGGGHFQDGSTLTKQLREKKVAAKFIGLLVAPPEPSFAELGDAAFGVVGPSQWEPTTAFNAKEAKTLGLSWYGPTAKDFVKAYKAAYKDEEPSYHAAGGYVSGLILQAAIEQAGTLDTQKVKAALDKTDLLSFYGHVKFDTSAEKHGLQTGHEMVYIQWQRDSSAKLSKQTIWPEAGKSAEIIYPLP